MNRNLFIESVLEAEQTLYNVSKTILSSDKDCEDAVQNAILKAYEKLDTLKDDKLFKTWIVRILINECYTLIRKNKKSVSVDINDYENIISSEEKEEYSELHSAIQKLPDKIKIAIVLYYVEGYSISEVTKILKIPSGTVKSRLSKGRKLLKNKLELMEVDYE